MNWHNFWTVLWNLKLNDGLVFFLLVDLNLAAATDPTENPYLDNLGGDLITIIRGTCWILTRCGGPGRNQSLKILRRRQFGPTFDPAACFDEKKINLLWFAWTWAESPAWLHLTCLGRILGNLTRKLPRKRYVSLTLKPREKKEIPHVFEEKLTIFSSLFHATHHLPNNLELSCLKFVSQERKHHRRRHHRRRLHCWTQGRREAYPPDLRELVHTATKLPPMNTPLKLSEKRISETWPHGIQ